jgi:hypothetical protein
MSDYPTMTKSLANCNIHAKAPLPIFDPADFEHGAQTTNNDRLRHAGYQH